jgi:SAM-dependent methyltransferase
MIRDEPLKGVIDRSLNYGRRNMGAYLRQAAAGRMDVVLDIGAGKGDDLLLARAAHPGAELHAIEVYPPYQDALRAKNIAVHALNIERDRFPFGDGAVDVVMGNQILEHVKEIFWVLHEASRILRVGGSLIIGVPNLAALHNRLLLALGNQPTCLQNQSAHVRGYTKSDLLALLGGPFPGGYELTRFSGSNFYPFPPVLARPLSALLPNMAWGIFLLFEKRRPYGREFLDHPVKHQLETNFYLGGPR